MTRARTDGFETAFLRPALEPGQALTHVRLHDLSQPRIAFLYIVTSPQEMLISTAFHFFSCRR
jgi:hypothetical protein